MARYLFLTWGGAGNQVPVIGLAAALAGRGHVAGLGGPELPPHLADEFVERELEQLVLAAEDPQHRRHGDAGPRGDVIEPDIRAQAAAQQLHRRGEHAAAGLLRARGAGPHRVLSRHFHISRD